jgi:alpha-beta hydrolase superfamily lysophospholipase
MDQQAISGAGGIGLLPYHLSIPAKPKHNRLLIVIHGVDTRAEHMLALVVARAMRRGITVMAPDFSGPAYKKYQILAGSAGAMASSDALCAAIAHAQQKLGFSGPADIMGFSAGAQFAHRFAMFHPHLVKHLVLAASGWYTYLDQKTAYPFGIAPAAASQSRQVDIDNFLSIPKLIIVGEQDIARDAQLRVTPRADKTGLNRLDRACNWHNHLRKLSPGVARLVILPGVAHSVTQAFKKGGLGKAMFNFLDDKRAQSAQKNPEDQQ